jgi:hypothetical protein
MDDMRIPEWAYHCALRGKRDINCPRKKWEAETGGGDDDNHLEYF